MATYSIYILTNVFRTVLYIGITNNLWNRIEQHRSRQIEVFTKKYNIKYLLYYEEFTDVHGALAREKQLKGWRRSKKERLISEYNPDWSDLTQTLSFP